MRAFSKRVYIFLKMDLLSVTPKEKKMIHKLHNIEESQIKENIEIIKKWIKQQSYVPQNQTDDLIEQFLLRNKFNIEETKKNFDNYYRFRGEYPEYFKNWKNLMPSKSTTTFFPMPNLTPNLERIFIYKIQNSDPELFDFYETAQLGLADLELTIRYDYSNGIRYICDFDNFQYGHLNRINPFPLSVFLFHLENVYSEKIQGVDYINCPPFISKFLEVIKVVVPPKLFQMIKIHENIESLHQVVPKEYLPVEYGGPTYKIPDLLRKWDETFIKHQNFFMENYEIVRQFNRMTEKNDIK